MAKKIDINKLKKTTESDTLKKDKEEQKEISIKKQAAISALEKSLGVVTTAFRSIGLHRSTHYDWCNEDPEYKRQVDGLKTVALDFAESQLHQQIKDGSTAATIFYLKTQGKKRGYIERIEVEDMSREPIEVLILDPTNEKKEDADQSE